jgi:putative ABC transport system ATP-binding protein
LLKENFLRMAACLLQAVDLSRTIPTGAEMRPILRDISFAVGPGDVLAITGPSGAGKSTLLRLLNRLDEPSSGDVLLHGTSFRSLSPPELRRRVGMVMQRAYLFPGTVYGNIAYGPAQHGLPFIDRDADSLLEQVGMVGYGERNALTLSGGEAQRISIARSLANQPEVLLLDEPTSALDPEAKQAVETLLARLVRERRLACVWVTHDYAQARRVADRILRIEAGAMTALGTPADVLVERE